MARPVAVDPHDRRRSPSQRRTSLSHQLRRTPGEKQRPRSYKPPGQTVNTADSARTMSGALRPAVSSSWSVLVISTDTPGGGDTAWSIAASVTARAWSYRALAARTTWWAFFLAGLGTSRVGSSSVVA